jgi:maleamate amidohydrolase
MTDSRAENYAAGGFGLSLQPGDRPALLVVDFVKAYLVPGSPLYAAAERGPGGHRSPARGCAPRRHPGGCTPACDTSAAGATGGCSSARCRPSPASRRALGRSSRPLPSWTGAAAGETVITQAVRECVLRHDARLDAHRAARRHTADRGGQHQRLRARQRGGRLPARFRAPGGPRGRRRPSSGEPHEASLFDLQAKYAEVVSLEFAADYLRRVGSGAG